MTFHFFRFLILCFFVLTKGRLSIFSSRNLHSFAFLPNKERETYERLFQALKTLVPEMDPETLMVDFEVGAIAAFKAVFESPAQFEEVRQGLSIHICYCRVGHGSLAHFASLHRADLWGDFDKIFSNYSQQSNLDFWKVSLC